MVNTILRRKRFKISNLEIFCNGFMKCCCRHRNRFIKDSTWLRYRFIEKAEHMLNRKLDILELLKAVQRNQTGLRPVHTDTTSQLLHPFQLRQHHQQS